MLLNDGAVDITKPDGTCSPTLTIISMLSLFECITCSSSLSMEEIELLAIFNWIFHVSEFLRLFIMSLEYDLILSRYSSTDSVLFLSLLLSYSI